MKKALAFGKLLFGISILWILTFQVSLDVNSQEDDEAKIAAEIAADLAAGVKYAPPSGVVLFRPTKRTPQPKEEMITPGPNVPVCPDPNPQNETTITAYLPQVGHLVGGANDYCLGDARAGFYHSTDGGATWDCSLIPLSMFTTQGDPAVESDTAGNFYYSYIEFNRTDNRGGIFVNKGNGHGPGTSSPVIVHPNASTKYFEDKEYIAVDTGLASPRKNRVYVSWTNFRILGPLFALPRIVIASSPTGAEPWTYAQVSDTKNEQGSVPAVDANGTVYVAWEHFKYRNKPDSILIDQSTDGGLTWGVDQVVANITPLPSPLPPTSFRVNSFPTIAVGNVGQSKEFKICVAWADYRNGDADIYFTSASNIAGSWSTPVRVNNDQIENGKDQFFPRLNIAPSGEMVIVFYDRRDDLANVNFNLYSAVSTDGGLTWENARISSAPSDPANDGFGGQFIGDHNGVVAVLNRFHPLWTDTRSGNADAFTSATTFGGGWPSDPTVNVPICTAADKITNGLPNW